MNTPIRIILVEDNPRYREVIELALFEEPTMELIAQFGAAEVAIHTLQTPAVSESFDIILLDIRLPGMNGVDAIPLIQRHASKAKIIMLTQSDMEADVIRSIQAGAAGYLLKSSSIKEIAESIQMVAEGNNPLDPSVAKYLIQEVSAKKTNSKLQIKLSPRELDILQLLSNGLVKKEIADKLNISVHTVAEYVKNIYAKLGVQNAPSAVAKAFKFGILDTKE